MPLIYTWKIRQNWRGD